MARFRIPSILDEEPLPLVSRLFPNGRPRPLPDNYTQRQKQQWLEDFHVWNDSQPPIRYSKPQPFFQSHAQFKAQNAKNERFRKILLHKEKARTQRNYDFNWQRNLIRWAKWDQIPIETRAKKSKYWGGSTYPDQSWDPRTDKKWTPQTNIWPLWSLSPDGRRDVLAWQKLKAEIEQRKIAARIKRNKNAAIQRLKSRGLYGRKNIRK